MITTRVVSHVTRVTEVHNSETTPQQRHGGTHDRAGPDAGTPGPGPSADERWRKHRLRQILVFVTLPGRPARHGQHHRRLLQRLADPRPPKPACQPEVVPAPARRPSPSTSSTPPARTAWPRRWPRASRSASSPSAGSPTPPRPGTSPSPPSSTTGRAGLDQALLVQQQIPGSELFEDEGRASKSVDVVVGLGYTDMVPLPPRFDPLPPEITVNVYNTTFRTGLASVVAKDVKGRGFKVKDVSNDPLKTMQMGTALIRYGEEGDLAAKIVAQHVPGATLLKDDRAGTQRRRGDRQRLHRARAQGRGPARRPRGPSRRRPRSRAPASSGRSVQEGGTGIWRARRRRARWCPMTSRGPRSLPRRGVGVRGGLLAGAARQGAGTASQAPTSSSTTTPASPSSTTLPATAPRRPHHGDPHATPKPATPKPPSPAPEGHHEGAARRAATAKPAAPVAAERAAHRCRGPGPSRRCASPRTEGASGAAPTPRSRRSRTRCGTAWSATRGPQGCPVGRSQLRYVTRELLGLRRQAVARRDRRQPLDRPADRRGVHPALRPAVPDPPDAADGLLLGQEPQGPRRQRLRGHGGRQHLGLQLPLRRGRGGEQGLLASTPTAPRSTSTTSRTPTSPPTARSTPTTTGCTAAGPLRASSRRARAPPCGPSPARGCAGAGSGSNPDYQHFDVR